MYASRKTPAYTVEVPFVMLHMARTWLKDHQVSAAKINTAVKRTVDPDSLTALTLGMPATGC
jgi:hypothetical protein